MKLCLSSDDNVYGLVYRDRERGVARYNEFRRNMLMIPISTWEDLTEDKEVIRALEEVYGDDVEKLDLLVGLHAERKIKGFAISETAFFIFLLMASRYRPSHTQVIVLSPSSRFRFMNLHCFFCLFPGGWRRTGSSQRTSTQRRTQKKASTGLIRQKP